MPLESLDKALEKIEINNTLLEHKELANYLLNNPSSKILTDNFTEFELSIILLLTIGCDIMVIARYKGIAEVRLRHIITNIQSSEAWNDLWDLNNGFKKSVYI